MEPVSQCLICKHLNDATVAGRMACAAFPKGIPGPILTNDADHRAPFNGDGGTRWEAADKDESEHPLDSSGIGDTAVA